MTCWLWFWYYTRYEETEQEYDQNLRNFYQYKEEARLLFEKVYRENFIELRACGIITIDSQVEWVNDYIQNIYIFKKKIPWYIWG